MCCVWYLLVYLLQVALYYLYFVLLTWRKLFVRPEVLERSTLIWLGVGDTKLGDLDQDSGKWRPFAIRVMNVAITCLIPTKILCDRFGSVNFSPVLYFFYFYFYFILFYFFFTLSLISVVSIQTTKYYCVFLKIHFTMARVFFSLLCSGSGSTRMT